MYDVPTRKKDNNGKNLAVVSKKQKMLKITLKINWQISENVTAFTFLCILCSVIRGQYCELFNKMLRCVFADMLSLQKIL